MPRKPVLCLYCGKPIKSGRADKKFCDSGCKDSYNNARKEGERGEIRTIDLVLKKNRRVLKKLYDPSKPDKKFSREMLIREGFEFGFLTHVAVTKTKMNEIVFCYDYGYREINEDNFQLFPSFSKIQIKGGYSMKVN
ncbi:MAG: hypothetical protein JNJ86_12350 [Chitinophagaceae bacterium]|nr:hypothetical protein [Chitinophagaceae bacterium]